MSPKSVLVTGASADGIGSALAVAFQKRGFRVFAAVRDPEKGAHLASLPNVEVVTLDVTSAASIAAAVETVRKAEAGLDILVNNSGSGYTMPLVDSSLEQGKKLFDVNLWGMLAMVQAFVPLLIDSGGTVVNISSVAAIVPTPWIGIYSASKAAATLFSETLRLELQPLGVHVVTVMTGTVASRFFQNLPSFQLPAESPYKSIESKVAESATGKAMPKSMSADVFAERVVNDVLGGARGQIWRGNMATITRWVTSLIPKYFLDGMITDGRGLSELASSTKSSSG